MQLSDFDFPFDPSLVATEPTLPREHAKLLVLNPHQQAIMHRRIDDLSIFWIPEISSWSMIRVFDQHV